MSESTNKVIYVDPVCGYKITNFQNTLKVVHKNEELFFCSKKCLSSFEKNPDKFAGLNYSYLKIRKKVTANLEGSDFIFRSIEIPLAEPGDKKNILAVTKKINEQEGVLEARISQDYQKILIRYNPDLMSKNILEEILTECGLKIDREKTEKIVFFLENAFFDFSFPKIWQKLEQEEGVKKVKIGSFSEELLIEFNPEKIDLSDLKKKVKNSFPEILEIGETAKIDDLREKRKLITKENGNRLKKALFIFCLTFLFSENSEFLHYSGKNYGEAMIFFVSLFAQITCSDRIYLDSFLSLKNKLFDFKLIKAFSLFLPFLLSSLNYLFSFMSFSNFILGNALLVVFLFSETLQLKLRDKFFFLIPEPEMSGENSKNEKSLSKYFYRLPLIISFFSMLIFCFWFFHSFNEAIVNTLTSFTGGIILSLYGYPSIFYLQNIASQKGKQNGFLFKNNESLRVLGKVKNLFINKTGLLTKAKPILTDIITFNGYDGNTVLKIVSSVQNHYDSVLAEVIREEAKLKNFNFWQPKDLNYIFGLGIEANVNGYQVITGSKKLMKIKKINTDQMSSFAKKLAEEGKTPLYVAISGKAAGLLGITDLINTEAVSFIEKISRYLPGVFLFTGDNNKTSSFVGSQVGIKMANIFADLTPGDKIRKIEQLKKSGLTALLTKKINNDDPVLQTPDIILDLSNKNEKIEGVNFIRYSDFSLESVVSSIILSKRYARFSSNHKLLLFLFLILVLPLSAGFFSFLGFHLNPLFSLSIFLIFLALLSLNINYFFKS